MIDLIIRNEFITKKENTFFVSKYLQLSKLAFGLSEFQLFIVCNRFFFFFFALPENLNKIYQRTSFFK